MKEKYMIIEHNAYMNYSHIRTFETLEEANKIYKEYTELGMVVSLIEFKFIK